SSQQPKRCSDSLNPGRVCGETTTAAVPHLSSSRQTWENAMTTHSSFAFRSAVDRFAAWRKHRRDLHDLADLGGVDFCAIARDLRLSPGDLEAVAKNDGSRAENLDGLLSM